MTDPASRDRGLRFRIGDAFPSDDPIARWATVLGMAINNTVYVNIRIIEGELPPELHVYYFRLVAAHFFESCVWLEDTPRHWPQVAEFLHELSQDSLDKLERLQGFAKQDHPQHERLRRLRNTMFHYPEMHPSKERAGIEELAKALHDARDVVSSIEGGLEYASFRASFADEVTVQFVSPDDEGIKTLLEELSGPMFELIEFGEQVLLAHLKRIDSGMVTPF